MSKGPGKVMRAISVTLEMSPLKQFTIENLADFAYPNAPYTEEKHKVAVCAAVRRPVELGIAEIVADSEKYVGKGGWHLKAGSWSWS
jgi:hypothetical protein